MNITLITWNIIWWRETALSNLEDRSAFKTFMNYSVENNLWHRQLGNLLNITHTCALLAITIRRSLVWVNINLFYKYSHFKMQLYHIKLPNKLAIAATISQLKNYPMIINKCLHYQYSWYSHGHWMVFDRTLNKLNHSQPMKYFFWIAFSKGFNWAKL